VWNEVSQGGYGIFDGRFFPIPRQEFIGSGCRMVVYAAQAVGEPGFGVDVVELAGFPGSG
jgi:hypothetical protein